MTTAIAVNNFGWVDPHSPGYRPDIIQLIEDVAANKVDWAKNRLNLHIEFDDLQSELIAHILTKPNLIADNKFPSKILHSVASDFCFKSRKDKGAAILSTETLHSILSDFNSMPNFVRSRLYGPVFEKAGKPSGSYLAIIEQEYKYGNKIIGASNKRTLSRAVSRLAEVISGTMVGNPESYEALAQTANVPSYTMEEDSDFDDDPTFAPYVGIYRCSNHHAYRINTGDKPENRRIGLKTELGYYKCKCGEVLYLDSREVVDEVRASK